MSSAISPFSTHIPNEKIGPSFQDSNHPRNSPIYHHSLSRHILRENPILSQPMSVSQPRFCFAGGPLVRALVDLLRWTGHHHWRSDGSLVGEANRRNSRLKLEPAIGRRPATSWGRGAIFFAPQIHHGSLGGCNWPVHLLSLRRRLLGHLGTEEQGAAGEETQRAPRGECPQNARRGKCLESPNEFDRRRELRVLAKHPSFGSGRSIVNFTLRSRPGSKTTPREGAHTTVLPGKQREIVAS